MAIGKPSRLHFRRFECKYRITEGQAQALRQAMDPYVEPDPHAARQADHTYNICSLYLDSPDLRLHRQTQEGICDRYKLRIRAYNDDLDQPVFVEIKSRDNQVITKDRSPIPRTALPAALGLASFPEQTGGNPKVLSDFVRRAQGLGAVPITMVRYRRQAYQGIFDSSHRLTMDRQILSRATTIPEVTMAHSEWDPVSGNEVVLELKFNERFPRWMADIVRTLGLERVSYSKYSESVFASHRHGNLRAQA